jgi:hypothetical protein
MHQNKWSEHLNVSLGPTDSYITSSPSARGLSITLMMEAARTSETSVHYNEPKRSYIPEGCHLNTRRRENLKSHLQFSLFAEILS